MRVRLIVIDTNVLVSALRSRRGASFRLLALVGLGKFDIALSVPLVLEYEDALGRLLREMPLDEHDIAQLLDYLCLVAIRQPIYYLWRPFLRDPKDDMVLEVAVAAGCDSIVTYNQRDFQHARRFGIRVVTARAFLEEIGELR